VIGVVSKKIIFKLLMWIENEWTILKNTNNVLTSATVYEWNKGYCRCLEDIRDIIEEGLDSESK